MITLGRRRGATLPRLLVSPSLLRSNGQAEMNSGGSPGTFVKTPAQTLERLTL